MVKSIISKEVNYNESKEIEDEDIDYSAPLFDYKLYSYDIEIGLGRQKHTYSNRGIVYFPIYLIVNGEIASKIGVYEVEDKKMIDILDDEGDVQLKKEGLLFFVSKEYLRETLDKEEAKSKPSDEDEPLLGAVNDILSDETKIKNEEEEDDVAVLVIPPEKRSIVTDISEKTLKNGIFDTSEITALLPMLPEENEEKAKQIKESYEKEDSHNWVVKSRKNPNYKIIDNEGGGDCFFAVLRDAFKQLGKETTVEKLRALLANEATEDMFQESRMLYATTLGEYQEKEHEMKQIKKTIEQLKVRIEKGSEKLEQEKLLNNVNELVEKYNGLKKEKQVTNELLKEFIHMEGLDTLEKFRKYILTSDYWADTWAVSTMERLLNVKVIILSKSAFDAGDMDSVLNCGQLNDTVLEKKGVFQPDYYIMTAYTGNHYTLVSYKDRHILKFSEIPYDIKIMIITKCLEKNAGPYYLIKDFRNLKTKLGLHENEGEPVEQDEFITADLYDAKTTLMFYQNSDSHPKAGKGSGEKTDNLVEFNRLNTIKDWRRKLDDTWMVIFSIDGNKWPSVTHYFLGSQFKKGFPDYALKYSFDSNSPISKSVKAAKDEYNRVLKTKKSALMGQVSKGGPAGSSGDSITITPDPDFFTVKENPIFEVQRMKALEAKFNQNLDMKQILLETKDAKLIHFERGKEAPADMLLMKLRKRLS
jgi:hypothetical protein